MRHSDIFDEFAKIAQANGLISQATPEEIQKKLEENPRMDSLDVSAIAALYGLKPDAPKDMQYKRNIIENAHKETVVVSPSYDKINGLVENVNQRQDIIMNIINRTPDGQIINRKYAEKQLLLTLVRLGNDLDNKKKDELRILADVCLDQTAKITKKAIAPAAIAGIVVGIGAIIGGIWLHQHLGFKNEGFQTNHSKLIAEIDDMLGSNSNLGYGSQYSQNFITKLQEFKNKLIEMKSKYDEIFNVIDAIETPKTGKQLLDLAKSPESKSIIDAYNMFKAFMDDFRPYINTIESNFKKETYKIKQVEDKGWMSKVVDWTDVLHGGKGMIADDFDDVVRAIEPYKKSIEEILKTLGESESIQRDAKKRLDAAASQSRDYKPPTSPKPNADIGDETARGLEDQLSGFGLPSIGT